ncbi:DUF1153 domain-containing protein [Polymorphobacter megasporae]|nr:DUF1153 domain-containing protein [Polymorphobacter sp. PAMC 29334]UAJ09618.1 DUF1153 domain-containing protein [Polymorphobacter megasporae]
MPQRIATDDGLSAVDRMPPSDTKRWVASRKADVVRGIREGVVTRTEACTRYSLSDEELRLWERAIDAAGTPGLRVTRVQVYREVFESRH